MFDYSPRNQVPRQLSAIHPNSLCTRFRNLVDTHETTDILLQTFMTSEIAQIVCGCSADGRGMTVLNNGFHPDWLPAAGDRQELHAWIYRIFSDMVCVSCYPESGCHSYALL
jgi:hypothetical protein